MKRNLYVLILLGFCTDISVFGKAVTEPELGINIVEQLRPGTSTKKEIRKLLGTPDEVVDLSQLPNSKDKGELWEYERTGYARVSASFDSSSEVLVSITFNVRKEDREQNLRAALARFSGANWKVETTPWINPHAFPDECYFVDAKLGVSVEYRRTRNEVSSIFRWNPLRQLASEENGPPPKFCIDGKCFDGIPAKEWLKNWSPCELPQ